MNDEKETEKRLKRIEIGLYEIQQAFMAIEKLGLHKDILMCYLRQKSKLPLRDIEDILWYQKDFYKKLKELGKPGVKP